MPNQEHLAILEQGVEKWNEWRENDPEIGTGRSRADFSDADLSDADLSWADLSWAELGQANLSGADLGQANLSGADLSDADLSRANLSDANLGGAYLGDTDFSDADLSDADFSRASLSRANLSRADLSRADLSRANLSDADLSGAIIDEHTTYYKIIGCKKGVNGIWSEGTDSAALMQLTPPGNSMQGPNPEAVIENLKRSRRLHGFSLSLVGIVLLIQVLGLKEVEFLWLKGLKLSPERFAWLALPISIGLLSLVNTFMTSALTGAQYINDRLSATSVGNFPWALSRYAGGIKKRKFPWALSRYAGGIKKRKAVLSMVSFFLIKSQSFITRFIMSFHPLAYIYFFWNQPLGTPSELFNPGKSPAMVFSPLIFYSLAGLAIIFSAWTFYLSHRFQRPILFDRQTEEMRRDNLTILSDSVKEQTKAVTELVEILKPKPADQAVNEDKDFTEQASGAPDNIKSNHQPKSI